MQNKGFVSFVTGGLAVICAYYLSFSFVTQQYDEKAETMEPTEAKAYLDSMATQKVWLGYTLKQARNQQIGLGLDLKGGMNVVLKLNAGNLLKSLANDPEDPNFYKAIEKASQSGTEGGFIEEFVRQYEELEPNVNLAVLFGNASLRDQINPSTSRGDVIKLLKKEYNSAIDASFNVLRTRIDRFGVVAPNLQRLEGQGRILVELPGVKEPERVRELLSRSANLQFWRTHTIDEVAEDIKMINNRLSEIHAGEELAPIDTTGMDSVQIAQAQVKRAELEAQRNNILFSKLQFGGSGATVGYAKSADRDAIDALIKEAKERKLLRDDLELLWSAKPIEDKNGKELDSWALYAIRSNRSHTPDLSGEVVTKASQDVDNSRGYADVGVSMSMNTEGTQKWARLTKEAAPKKRQIAIVLDGVVYSAPGVQSAIENGTSRINGNFTIEEAQDLANVLNSGKMETTIVVEQESVVGPTLGAASIKAGIISFAIALILLMLYMCLAYGLIPGMVANTALIINSFFTLGILASFHAVLTLSGIAGLVLTLGMAVDANVLINERIKEELRKGKDMSRAIADGYGNAFSAIFDSNLTTIITGVVLFYFGTGPIRGFATTLITGLVASFITAVFLTRMIFEALDKAGKLKNVTYDTALTRNILVDNNYNILGSRKKGYIFPIAILVLGLVAFFTVGLNKGIEFSGGRNYIVKFDQKVDNDKIREALAPSFDDKLVLTSIGTDGDQLRISTNYGVEENTEAVELEIKTKLYEGLKPFFKNQASSADVFENEHIISSQKVSASMSSDITRGALIAVVVALLFMALYILIRFRDIAFSIGAFASVTVTTFIIFSIYTLAWTFMPFSMEVDQNFIAAVLAIIGYAINDVVIVFDRIREEVSLYPNRDRGDVINTALNATLSRTLNTSFTTLLVMLIVFALGGASMRSFTFVILLGVIFGTYCTLFVATPIAYEVYKARSKK